MFIPRKSKFGRGGSGHGDEEDHEAIDGDDDYVQLPSDIFDRCFRASSSISIFRLPRPRSLSERALCKTLKISFVNSVAISLQLCALSK